MPSPSSATPNALITSFDARPGEVVVAAIDQRGAYRNYDNFFAAGDAPHSRLRADLELLPRLAEEGLVRSGKDISQSGIAGTALMLAEASGVSITLDLESVDPPPGVPLARWLRSFPSYGFLLSLSPSKSTQVCRCFLERDIRAAVVGTVTDGTEVRFSSLGGQQTFWDYACEPYLGFRQEGNGHA